MSKADYPEYIYNAAAEARRIIEKAREQAAQIVEAAQPEIESRWAEIEAERQRLIEAVEDERRQSLVESDTNQFLLQITVRITDFELREYSDATVDMAAQVIQKMYNQTKILIRVNPADLTHLTHTCEQMGQSCPIDFQNDHKIQPGSCILESETDTVNTQFKTQLALMEKALLKCTK